MKTRGLTDNMPEIEMKKNMTSKLTKLCTLNDVSDARKFYIYIDRNILILTKNS